MLLSDLVCSVYEISQFSSTMHDHNTDVVYEIKAIFVLPGLLKWKLVLTKCFVFKSHFKLSVLNNDLVC